MSELYPCHFRALDKAKLNQGPVPMLAEHKLSIEKSNFNGPGDSEEETNK